MVGCVFRLLTWYKLNTYTQNKNNNNNNKLKQQQFDKIVDSGLTKALWSTAFRIKKQDY